MNHKCKKILLFLALVLLLSQIVSAQEITGFSSTEEGQEKKNRIELSGRHEYLTPNDTYGDWDSLIFRFTRKQTESFAYFVELAQFLREEDGTLITLGAYKDWSDRLYTYSALAFGTKTDFLPSYRVDHDFNFKMGGNSNIVWTLGASYIKYFDVHRDFILSTGVTYYFEKGALSYRVFRNQSEPGNVVSFSQAISARYGTEGLQWTELTLSFGKQSYLATNISPSEEINQSSLGVVLYHKHWLGEDYGIFGDISYSDIEDGYKKYGLSVGIFKDF